MNTFNPFDLTAFGATLNGGVNPNGLATTANFQWGLTTSYGNTTPVQSVGAGTTQQFIDGGAITGLTCSTVYHFRATATNANGTSNGNDVTFTTTPCTPGAFTGVAAVVGQTGATLLGARESERHADERALRVGRDDGLRQHHPGSGDGLGP